MAVTDRGLAWRAVGGLSGLAAGMISRMLVGAVWRRLKGAEPPGTPVSPRIGWSDALTWAISSGIAIAVARVVGQRGAAEAWKATTGSYPPEVEGLGG